MARSRWPYPENQNVRCQGSLNQFWVNTAATTTNTPPNHHQPQPQPQPQQQQQQQHQ